MNQSETEDYNKKLTDCGLSVISQQLKLVQTALDLLCDSFLFRAHDDDPDPQWHLFYNIQMRSYLSSKGNLDVSAPEGDMVHDLIRDTWEHVHSCMTESVLGPISNLENLFRTVRIDFPVVEKDTFFDLSFCENEFMGQNDTVFGI